MREKIYTDEELKKRKLEYIDRHNKECYVNVGFRLNRENDADIIGYLGGIKGTSSYLKSLIRQDMASKGIDTTHTIGRPGRKGRTTADKEGIDSLATTNKENEL